jgi:hypothetical protein
MDSKNEAIALWEDGLATFECTLRRVHIECDAKHVQADTAQ